MKIIFIRHEKTKGNLEKRYIGSTDENLLPESIVALKNRNYPTADKIYCSPMKRTIQTANTIYPTQELFLIDDLRERDFGEFENKNYIELSNNADYQRWIDSNATLPFPKGEKDEDFKLRTISAFEKIVKQNNCSNFTIAIIAHGGTIMSIFDKFSYPHKDFYDWQIKNGEYIVANYQDGKILYN